MVWMMSRLLLALLLTATVNMVAGQDSLEPCSVRYVDDDRGFENRLQQAVDANDYDCVLEFLEAGDDPNWYNRFGATSVSYAAIGSTGEIMQLLLDYGGEADKVLGSYPPIQQAACYGLEPVVKVLVDSGVSRAKRTIGDNLSAADSVCNCVDEESCPEDSILALLEQPNSAVSFNTDLPSEDGALNDGSKDLTTSNKECWELCEKTEGCKAWTRIKRTQENGSTSGECWLRSYKPEPKPCNYCDSGVTSCPVISNVDYPSPTGPGVLNLGQWDLTSNNEECCARCTATPECKVWTRIKSSTQYNQEGECWLRDFVPDQMESETSDSGLMS